MPVDQVVDLLARWREASGMLGRGRVLGQAMRTLAGLTPDERRTVARALAERGAPVLAERLEDESDGAIQAERTRELANGLLSMNDEQIDGLIHDLRDSDERAQLAREALDRVTAPSAEWPAPTGMPSTTDGPAAPPPPPPAQVSSTPSSQAGPPAPPEASHLPPALSQPHSDAGAVAPDLDDLSLAEIELDELELGTPGLHDVGLETVGLQTVELGTVEPESSGKVALADGPGAGSGPDLGLVTDPTEVPDGTGTQTLEAQGTGTGTAVALGAGAAGLAAAPWHARATTDAARTLDRLREATTASERLAALPRTLDAPAAQGFDGDTILHLLDAVPEGWQRRRVALRLAELRAIPPEDAGAVVAALGRASDAAFLAGALLAAGTIDLDALDGVLDERTVRRLRIRAGR